ncbi:MAG: hypothetical protein OEY14_00530, partial [Myxococcales bacterium]|nr:hypothetical protein [Myxococcales bacterium]
TDPYRNGLNLREATFGEAAGSRIPLGDVQHRYEDCPLAEIPASGLRLPIRYVCHTGTTRIVQEGAAESEWATLQIDQSYDGYGQLTLSSDQGLIHHGPPSAPVACGPCGADSIGPCGDSCLGDERFTETSYIDPGAATGGAWQLGSAWRIESYGDASGPRSETRLRYDGEPFVGLPEGTLSQGLLTSRSERVSEADEWVYSERNSRDAHGNVIEALMPNGDPAILDDHRRIYVYDDLDLKLRRIDVLVSDGAGATHRLRRELTYESSFNAVSESTDWMLVLDGTVVSARNPSRYRYDAFGRVARTLFPGDAESTPGEEYFYELADPVSRIIVRSRSQAAGELDLEEIRCVDGQGREVQRRRRLMNGSYHVSGFETLNRRGQPVRRYQAYVSNTSACELSPPSHVRYEAYQYDALGRAITTTIPDESIYGSRSEIRIAYVPLGRLTYDSEDSDASSPHADTPLRERTDGLGRLLRLDRELADGSVGSYGFGYDSLGRLASFRDPLGNEKVQSFDLLGRVVSIDDPNAGRISLRYDAAGNLIERSDARGRSEAYSHDAVGRLLGRWDVDDEANTRVELIYDRSEACAECTNGAGRLVAARYPLAELGEGLDELGYDTRGRIVFEGRTLEGHRFITRRYFDHASRLVRTVFPDGTPITRSYDDASRLTSIGGVIDATAYDDRGLLSTVYYANGTQAMRTFDAVMRSDSLQMLGASGQLLQGSEFTRSRLGNLLRSQDLADPSAERPSLSASYEYDAWYRLIGATFGEGEATESLTYEYDLLDNVLRRESSLGAASRAHVGSYEYDPERPNAALRAGTREYTYDAAGQMLSRGVASFSWDHAGRLIEATGSAGASGRFLYGVGADRVAKLEEGGATLYVNPELEIRDGIVNIYPRLERNRMARLRSDALQTTLLSDLAPLAEADSEINAADAWASFAAGAGLITVEAQTSDSTRLLRGAARRLLLADGDDLVYLHHDNLGSTTLATDANGEVVGEALYYPNGELRHRRGFTDTHGFTGQESDVSSGLVAFRHRYLDTASGRWASPDPAFLSLRPEAGRALGQASTGYAYVANNAPNANDPTGLAAKKRRGRGTRGAKTGAADARSKSALASFVRSSALAAVAGGVVGGPVGAAAAVGAVALSAGAKILLKGVANDLHGAWTRHRSRRAAAAGRVRRKPPGRESNAIQRLAMRVNSFLESGSVGARAANLAIGAIGIAATILSAVTVATAVTAMVGISGGVLAGVGGNVASYFSQPLARAFKASLSYGASGVQATSAYGQSQHASQ